MSEQPIKPTVKRRRWRTWHILCLVGVLPVAVLFLYGIIRQAHNEARLNAAIDAIEKDDPHWKLADFQGKNSKLPISPASLKCIAAVPQGYLGWAGDDITSRTGALDYEPQGRDYIYSVGTNGLDDQGDVLETTGTPKDRGTRLFNPELRGKKYQPSK